MNKLSGYALICVAAALCAAAFSASAAESVYTLIANGQVIIFKMKRLTAEHEQLKQKSIELAAAAATIGKAQPKLNQAVQQHNQADEQLQSDMSDYKKTCQSTDLNNSQHDRCNRRQKQLNAQIDQINSGTENLQVQQKALQQQIAQYNTESQALNEAIPDNTDAINKTFAAEEEWLDEARNLVAAPAFAPYRKAAGCPNVVNPPTTGKELQKMAGELLNCLQNLAHSTKPKHTAAAKGGTAGGA